MNAYNVCTYRRRWSNTIIYNHSDIVRYFSEIYSQKGEIHTIKSNGRSQNEKDNVAQLLNHVKVKKKGQFHWMSGRVSFKSQVLKSHSGLAFCFHLKWMFREMFSLHVSIIVVRQAQRTNKEKKTKHSILIWFLSVHSTAPNSQQMG